jgi:uncharacterized surface protein with fasciclin (FAS1) repeats
MRKLPLLITILLLVVLSACSVNVAVQPTATPAAGTIPEPTATAVDIEESAPLTATATTEPITATTALTTSPTVESTTVTATATTTATTAVTTTETLTATGAVTATDAMTTGVLSEMEMLPDTSGMTIGEVVNSLDSLSILATAVDAAGLGDALDAPGPITLFAPADAAFNAIADEDLQTLLADPTLLADVLQYHIIIDSADSAELARLGDAQSTSAQPIAITVGVNGELFVNEAQVVFADIPAANGTIHVISGVLTPPNSGLALPTADPAMVTLMNETADATLEELKRADTSGETVVEVISSISGLSIAARAIDAAGLTDALSQAGPFTLFVPTDPAFDQLPDEQFANLLNDTAALADVLQYHLVLDSVTSGDLATLPTLLTASGETLSVTVQSNGRILINSAPVYQTDIEASNGVIHVIGEVLTPIGQ